MNFTVFYLFRGGRVLDKYRVAKKALIYSDLQKPICTALIQLEITNSAVRESDKEIITDYMTKESQLHWDIMTTTSSSGKFWRSSSPEVAVYCRTAGAGSDSTSTMSESCRGIHTITNREQTVPFSAGLLNGEL